MNCFDLLRLGAAVLVILHHGYVLGGQAPPRLGFIDLGALAVGVFFVISGYLVTGSYLRTPKPGGYLLKRALRIVPGLLVALVLTAFVLGPLVSTLPPSRYFASAQPYLYVLRNVMLYPVTYALPGVFAHNPYPDAVNGSLWTLRLEFTGYLGIAVLGAARLLTRPVLAGLALLAAVVFLVEARLNQAGGHGDLVRLAELAAQNGFLFLAGGALKLHGRALPLWVVGASALLLLTPAWVLGLPAVTLAVGELRGPRLPGDISYGLYIYAFPLQQALASIGHLSLALSLVVTVPFAILSWQLIEKPALRFKPGRPEDDPRLARPT